MPGTYTPSPPPSTQPLDPTSWEPLAPTPPVQETSWQRFIKKFKEEPLVPVGIFATVVALGGATSALQKGNRTQFNKWLRYRVAAQGLTVAAALGGSVYYQRERRLKKEAERVAQMGAQSLI
ncbi:BQ2448_6486 [Microbotryum intermedium]|uniref:BQ2448_6486 protein n=1 Tax=Microbotryum intermedium TaxID=269621 RepID=A0A238FQ95_9BASI|nr:BQ2448_6486 [Microbotryum intermedium]